MRCGARLDEARRLHDLAYLAYMLVSDRLLIKSERAMPTIYISDSGDDKNDGLSPQTAIYSLKRAKELYGSRNDCSWHFGPRAWKRILRELSETGRQDDRQG